MNQFYYRKRAGSYNILTLWNIFNTIFQHIGAIYLKKTHNTRVKKLLNISGMIIALILVKVLEMRSGFEQK